MLHVRLTSGDNPGPTCTLSSLAMLQFAARNPVRLPATVGPGSVFHAEKLSFKGRQGPRGEPGAIKPQRELQKLMNVHPPAFLSARGSLRSIRPCCGSSGRAGASSPSIRGRHHLGGAVPRIAAERTGGRALCARPSAAANDGEGEVYTGREG